ncbi:MAG: hypothetical protein K2W95_31085 [Candidatus Obscuribacterales bacterium]|nr:hypothetical protein [Candidatus Obscuribacterales bacterium]
MGSSKFSKINTVYGKLGLVWVVIGYIAGSPTMQMASAQDAPAASVAQTSTTQSSEIHLDLGSTTSNITADHAAEVHITVGGTYNNGVIEGGTLQAIAPGSQITPAMYAAMQQVLGGQTQTILLNNTGAAAGGVLNLSSQILGNIAGITIPTSVSALSIGNSASNPLNIAGNTIIQGSLFALQTAPGLSSVLNIGGNLNIASGGLISGYMPNNLTYLGLGNLFSSSGLTLNVLGDVFNAGTITTPGVLNISAGGSIVNQTINNITANINAQVINMFSGAGSIVNSGTIAAIDAINVQTMMTRDLLIQNQGGLLQSINGNLNVRDLMTTGKVNSIIEGGDIIAKELNIFSGDGIARLNVNQLDGVVNITAGEAHILANTDNLVLGDIILSGDPTFHNTTGDVSLTGAMTFAGQALSIVAFGDVIANGTTSLNTSGASGGNILIAAGVLQNESVPGVTLQLLGPANPDGGFVDLTGVTTIDSRGTAGAGGNVTIAAYDGAGFNSGRVIAGGTSILTGGTGAANGNVTIIGADSNSSSSTAITVGAINTSGGTAGTGNISLAAAALSQSGIISVNIPTGVTSGGTFLFGAANPRGITVNGNLTSDGGTIRLDAGSTAGSANILVNGNINASNSNGIGGTVQINNFSSNAFVVGAAGTNGVTGNILANAGGAGNNKGGSITVTNNGTGGITVTAPTTNLQTTTTGSGAGGTLALIAGTSTSNGNLTLGTGSLSVAGGAGSSDGGTLTLTGKTISSGAGLLTLDASGGTGGTGNGGTVNLTLSTLPVTSASTMSAPATSKCWHGAEQRVETAEP